MRVKPRHSSTNKSGPGWNQECSVLVQVAQTVMSDLLSNPHHPAVNPNIILDNFLMDLRQSLITR